MTTGEIAIGITGVLATLIAAIGSAWLTAHLALRRFRTQQWWERKADAYAELIKNLSALNRVEANIHRAVLSLGEPATEEQYETLRSIAETRKNCMNAVFDSLDAGMLYYSRSVRAEIGKMGQQLGGLREDAETERSGEQAAEYSRAIQAAVAEAIPELLSITVAELDSSRL